MRTFVPLDLTPYGFLCGMFSEWFIEICRLYSYGIYISVITLDTLPKTNSSDLTGGLCKRKLIFQPQCFRCYVSFREGIHGYLFLHVSFSCASLQYVQWGSKAYGTSTSRHAVATKDAPRLQQKSEVSQVCVVVWKLNV